MKLKFKRQLASFVSAAVVFATASLPVCAAPATQPVVVGGLCGHHAAHTAECLAGTPCSHEHTQDCYQMAANCLHVHTDSCYSGNGVFGNCSHICSQATGCVTSALNCSHVHGDGCTYAAGATCGYACNSCNGSHQAASPSRQYYSGGGHHGGHHGGRHC